MYCNPQGGKAYLPVNSCAWALHERARTSVVDVADGDILSQVCEARCI
jgi:hypothetical protein